MSEGTCEVPGGYLVSFDTAADGPSDGFFAMVFTLEADGGLALINQRCPAARWAREQARRACVKGGWL